MIEVALVGGPMDGENVDVEVRQAEVTKDGCTYRYCEATGFYVYDEGEKAAKRSFRSKKIEVD